MITVEYTRLPEADPNIPVPAYETAGAAGMDLRANFSIDLRAGLTLAPLQRVLVPTGLKIAIPSGYEGQIRPRSGLALKHGISIPNAPGTIDSDYRGPLGVVLINLGDSDFNINHGDRIAQIVFAPVVLAELKPVETLAETMRSAGGFGSTGRS